ELPVHLLVPCLSLSDVLLGTFRQRLVETMHRRTSQSLPHRISGLLTQGNVLWKRPATHTLSPVVNGASVKVAGHRPITLLTGSNRPRNRGHHEVEVVEDKCGGGVLQQRGRGFDSSRVA